MKARGEFGRQIERLRFDVVIFVGRKVVVGRAAYLAPPFFQLDPLGDVFELGEGQLLH